MFQTGLATEKKIVLHVYKEGRNGKIETEFLKDYQGYLQSDDCVGYNGVEGTRILCHACTEKICGYRESAKRIWKCRSSGRIHKDIYSKRIAISGRNVLMSIS